MPFAASVLTGPADRQLQRILNLPKSAAINLIEDSSAALATPIML